MSDQTSGFLFNPLPKDSPGKTILLKEEYGEIRIVGQVNMVGFVNGEIVVTRQGDVYGRFLQENWAVSVAEDKPT